jgi:hypothetical protein
MYEKPTLMKMGKADDVILGIVTAGSDLDGHYVVIGFEFESDPEMD